MFGPRPCAVFACAAAVAAYACVGDDPATSASSTSSSGGIGDGGSSEASGADAATAACEAPRKTCGAACVDVLTDDAHCGDCSNLCKGTQCFNGVCDGARVKQVSAGAALACAVRVDGSVWCWGRGARGGFGARFEGTVGEKCNDGSASSRCSATPVKVPGLPPIDTVSVLLEGVCAVSKTREVWCWGRNGNGETGSVAATTTCEGGACVVPPAKIANVPATVTQVSLGFAHACALTVDGAVWCWGDPTQGRLGRGNLTPGRDAAPVVGLPPANALSVSGDGNAHTCALVAADVWCWGANTGRALGFTSTPTACGGSDFCWRPKLASETGLPAGLDMLQVAAGYQHTCVLTAAAAVYCWGYHGYRAGTTGASPSLTARMVAAAANAKALAGRGGHVCVVKSDDTVACWGQSDGARIGKVDTPPVPPCVAGVGWACNDGSPNNVSLPNVSAVDAVDSSAALDASGRIWTWGTNQTGILGKSPTAILKTCHVVGDAGPPYGCSDVPQEVKLP